MIEDVRQMLYEAINWGLSEIRWFKRAEGDTRPRKMARHGSAADHRAAGLADRPSSARRDWFNGR